MFQLLQWEHATATEVGELYGTRYGPYRIWIRISHRNLMPAGWSLFVEWATPYGPVVTGTLLECKSYAQALVSYELDN